MPILVVQLGHCYRRTGATGTTGEQEYATKVGNACRALLHGRGGWSVRVILADDPSSSYAGDAFFAIHCDGSTSAAARGASVGYRTPEGQAAAQAWKRAYAARGWPGFRPDNYTTALAQYYGTGTAVSRGNRRAVILECGFRTNAEDRALLDGPGGPERVALSIGEALGIPVTPQETDMEPNTQIGQYYWRPAGAPPINREAGAAWANTESHASTAAQLAAQANAKLDALAGTVSNNQAAVMAAIADNGVEVDLTTEQMQELLTGMTTASKQALRELLGSLDN